MEVVLTGEQSIEDGEATVKNIMQELAVSEAHLLDGAYVDMLNNTPDSSLERTPNGAAELRRQPSPMRRFATRISRTANLFHFVNNLSQWHFSCRKHYNLAWLVETGELTPVEREALQLYAAIARRFPYGEHWIGRAFILADDESQAWNGVSRTVEPSDVPVLRSIFETMTPRFEKIWQADEPRLRKVRSELQGVLETESVGAVLDVLSRFLGVAAPRMTIDLLLSRADGNAGGANEAADHVTLEVLETVDLRHAVARVLHEAAHNMERPHFDRLFEAISSEYGLDRLKGTMGWDGHHLVREALIGALFPGGCLSYLVGVPLFDYQREAQRTRESGDLRMAGLYSLTGAVIPLVRSYVERCRLVDRALFEEAFHVFEALEPDIG